MKPNAQIRREVKWRQLGRVTGVVVCMAGAGVVMGTLGNIAQRCTL